MTQLTTPPVRSFLIFGLCSLIPMIVYQLGVGTEGRYSESFEMITAYWAFFAVILLVNAGAYWLKGNMGGFTKSAKSSWHMWLAAGAMVIFAIGALLGPTIGQQKVGLFVAASLLLFLASQIVFFTNLAVKKPREE